MGIFTNLKKRGFKDILSRDSRKAYIKWILKKLLRRFEDGDESTRLLKLHEIEQIIFRMKRCRPCVENKTCLSCGCDVLGSIQDPNSACHDKKWGKMLPVDKWNSFKKKVNFRF